MSDSGWVCTVQTGSVFTLQYSERVALSFRAYSWKEATSVWLLKMPHNSNTGSNNVVLGVTADILHLGCRNCADARVEKQKEVKQKVEESRRNEKKSACGFSKKEKMVSFEQI